METINVRYFHSKLPNLKYKGDEHYPYTKRRRNMIIDDIINAGYNVCLQQTTEVLIIWIDKYRFQQR
jgi:hypothetical protein